MRRLGVHTSIAGGVHFSIERAHELGCSTLQLFSHNPRGWQTTPLLPDECDEFKRLRKLHDINPAFIHASYLINLSSPTAETRTKSINLLIEEMRLADALGAEFVVLHTGKAVGQELVFARNVAIEGLVEVSNAGSFKAGILIENTAGQKGDITSTIVDISQVVKAVPALIKGVCIDTCHAYQAGYDVANRDGLKAFADEIEKHIGLYSLRLIHLNDSKSPLGGHLDRHEHIGEGSIGLKGIQEFLRFSPFSTVPLVLETPKKSEEDDPRNLRAVRKMLSIIAKT